MLLLRISFGALRMINRRSILLLNWVFSLPNIWVVWVFVLQILQTLHYSPNTVGIFIPKLDSLLSQWVTAKYFHNDIESNPKNTTQPSWVWKSVITSCNLIAQFFGGVLAMVSQFVPLHLFGGRVTPYQMLRQQLHAISNILILWNGIVQWFLIIFHLM